MNPEETEIRQRLNDVLAHAIPASRLAEHYVADVDALLRRAARAEGTLEDWAQSVLYAASGIVCTPQEGFVKAPHTLHRTVYDLRDACKAAQEKSARVTDLERQLVEARDSLTECASWLETLPYATEGDAACASRARAVLETPGLIRDEELATLERQLAEAETRAERAEQAAAEAEAREAELRGALVALMNASPSGSELRLLLVGFASTVSLELLQQCEDLTGAKSAARAALALPHDESALAAAVERARSEEKI